MLISVLKRNDTMNLWIPKNRTELKKHLSDPLFKNAYFLMLSSVTSAGSGFFFWLIAARFYSTADIGLASAIIAVGGLNLHAFTARFRHLFGEIPTGARRQIRIDKYMHYHFFYLFPRINLSRRATRNKHLGSL